MEDLGNIGLLPSHALFESCSRITALVDESWLEGITRAVAGKCAPALLQNACEHPEEYLHRSSPEPPCPWRRVSIKVVKKHDMLKVRRLKNLRLVNFNHSYQNLVNYLAEENYTNLWNNARTRYGVCSAASLSRLAGQTDDLQAYNDAAAMILRELYGDSVAAWGSAAGCRVDGVWPAYAVLQTKSAFYVVQKYARYSLRDLQTFSPAALGASHCKLLFIVYQLLRIAQSCHERGLALGLVSDKQVMMADGSEDGRFWVGLTPNVETMLQPVAPFEPCTRDSAAPSSVGRLTEVVTVPPVKEGNSLEAWSSGWVVGTISNFEYLMFLNKAVGRRCGDPNHHPVLPWVMDFTAESSGYRDLSKSKFRLNKGDEQLDMMYAPPVDVSRAALPSASSSSRLRTATYPPLSPSATAPHHVSAVLSDITYYTYMARRTPRDVLCAHVRPKWVPHEYPASVERLQEWTPDECIPEFFTDSTIFESIHDDLPDLKVPAWADTPERFVELHMSALESDHVSWSLHHWIDLTFGYKLRGDAAVEAKNICLQLADGHKQPQNHGIAQLFTRPHPARILGGVSKGGGCAAPPSSLAVLRRLSSAGVTAEAAVQSVNPSILQVDVEAPGHSADNAFWTTSAAGATIVLPSTYDPLEVLERAERACNLSRAHLPLFPKAFGLQAVDLVTMDMMGFGCVVVKALLPLDTATISCTSHNEADVRFYYERLRDVAQRKTIDIPKPFLGLVEALLGLKTGARAAVIVSEDGLPPLCPGLVLQPLLQIAPFPAYFSSLYDVICMQRKMDVVLSAAATASAAAERSQSLMGTVPASAGALCDEVVGVCLRAHASFLNKYGSLMATESVDLVTPYLVQLLRSSEEGFGEERQPSTWVQLRRADYAVQAAWTLFPCASQVLGPRETFRLIVPPLLRLYDSPIVPLASAKSLKLYHKTFVQQLCTQLGLEAFLAAGFVPRIARAVASFKDIAAGGSSEYHEQDADNRSEKKEEDEDRDIAQEEERDQQRGNIRPVGGDSQEECYFDNSAPATFCVGSMEEDLSAVPDEHIATGESVLATGPPSPSLLRQLYAQRCQRLSITSTASQQSGGGIVEDDYNVRHVAKDCMLWLAERFGPVLAAKHISEALLQTLKDSYDDRRQHLAPIGRESLVPAARLFASDKYVIGDTMSANVLQCLTDMAVLYGEQFVLLHYFNYILYMIQSCDSSSSGSSSNATYSAASRAGGSVITRSLESGLLSCITLLAHALTCLSDTTLLEVLVKTVVGEMLLPLIHIVSSSNCSFPSGTSCRSLAAYRTVDVMVIISTRIGFDQTRQYMRIPLQQLFLGFNVHSSPCGTTCSNSLNQATLNGSSSRADRRLNDSSDYVQIKQSSIDRNDFYVGSPVSIMSPIPSVTQLAPPHERLAEEVADELSAVFCAEFAHYSYVKFCKLAGGIYLQTQLHNEELVSLLCAEFDQQIAEAAAESQAYSEEGSRQTTWFVTVPPLPANAPQQAVDVVGNRISYTSDKGRSERPTSEQGNSVHLELLRRPEMTTNALRHLKGNWLAYWEHEWGLDKNDTAFKFKQIHLQDFTGHSGSVRTISVLDNENSFVSGGKDKTVKLWCLRSFGDGSAKCGSQLSYNGHKKTVSSVVYMEACKLIASSDGSVHVWDPFSGSCISQYEVSGASSDAGSGLSSLAATAIQSLFAPSSLLIAATSESTLRFVDVRARRFAHEFKAWQHTLSGTVGTISGLAVSQNNNFVALACSSGLVCIVDLRTGFPLSAWKAHDGEILQIQSFNEKRFVTSSMDNAVNVWKYDDAKATCQLKGHADPVRCIRFINSAVITATTGNRIGVHSSVGPQATFYGEKLRADAFKGVLTSMAVLPLNRLLLLGADNGVISLFA